MVFTRDGERLVIGHNDSSVAVWDIGMRERTFIAAAHKTSVRALAVHKGELVSGPGHRRCDGARSHTIRHGRRTAACDRYTIHRRARVGPSSVHNFQTRTFTSVAATFSSGTDLPLRPSGDKSRCENSIADQLSKLRPD